MFKRKKLTATSTLNHVADPSTNVVDQSVDSSASTTLTPEVNIDTATTDAAVPTTLDASSCVPEQGKQAIDNTKPALVGKPFQPMDPKYDFPPQSFSNGKKQKRFNRDWFKNEDWKSWLHYNAEKNAAFCSTCINAIRVNLITSKNANKTPRL